MPGSNPIGATLGLPTGAKPSGGSGPSSFLNSGVIGGKPKPVAAPAAKAGLDNIMKGLTVEWSKYGMRFVGIAPGPIADTGGADKLDPFKVFKYYNDYTNPTGRMCRPSEISDLALFLTSEKAEYINGSIIRIDGGEWIKNQGEFSFLTNIPFYDKLLSK